MIYLYGLLDANTPVSTPDLAVVTGVTGPVEVAQTAHGHLLYGPAAGADILPKRRYLLAHARVLEHFNAMGTVLPMRFGMSSPSVEGVRAMLEEKSEEIATSYTRLSGAAELGLRISFPRQAALEAVLEEAPALRAMRDQLAKGKSTPHFEVAELGRRLAEALGRRRDAAQKNLLAQLVPLCRDHVLRAPEEDTHVLRADILIEKSTQHDIIDAVEEMARACNFAAGAEPEIRLVGPVPAYNFVRLTLSADLSKAA